MHLSCPRVAWEMRSQMANPRARPCGTLILLNSKEIALSLSPHRPIVVCLRALAPRRRPIVD
jgi:hypothetical protein